MHDQSFHALSSMKYQQEGKVLCSVAFLETVFCGFGLFFNQNIFVFIRKKEKYAFSYTGLINFTYFMSANGCAKLEPYHFTC